MVFIYTYSMKGVGNRMFYTSRLLHICNFALKVPPPKVPPLKVPPLKVPPLMANLSIACRLNYLFHTNLNNQILYSLALLIKKDRTITTSGYKVTYLKTNVLTYLT